MKKTPPSMDLGKRDNGAKTYQENYRLYKKVNQHEKLLYPHIYESNNSKTGFVSYTVRIWANKKVFVKTFRTLGAAIKFRDKALIMIKEIKK